MTTPSCWKTKTTDTRFENGIASSEPATATSRVLRFPARGNARAALLASAKREKSSRTFAQSGLCDAQTHRVFRVRIARIDGSTWCSRARTARSRDRRVDAHRHLEKSLQAAPMLACRNRACCCACVCAHVFRSSTMRRTCVRPTRGARAAKIICDRLLTVEKTVIRFRPADVSCRSE